MKYIFEKCLYKEIESDIVQNNQELSSQIDSFAESHIIKSNHYKVLSGSDYIGYCSIHSGKILTQFYMDAKYRNMSQEVFANAKKMEFVSEAFVPTCDEFFLSLSLDNYSELKKQAYFFRYINEIEVQTEISINYRVATLDDLDLIKNNSENFFDDSLEKQIDDNEIFIGFENNNPIAFGVFERGRILKNYVSIGMFTHPEYRKNNIGKMTLKFLINESLKSNLIPIAGCWYYNHLSKRTLEGVGMISDTRYLKICF